MVDPLRITPRDGTILVRTDVAGRAARVGHRLVLAFDEWGAEVDFDEAGPSRIGLRVDIASLRVASGTGGAAPLTPVDRGLIRRNALQALDADAHPWSTFRSDSVAAQHDRLDVIGGIAIAGATRPLAVSLAVSRDAGRITASGRIPLRQTDFGIRPYSALLGSLRVADEVSVEIAVTVPGAWPAQI